MTIWDLPRIPLPDNLISEQCEAELYAPAATLRQLERWDDEFVFHALDLGVSSGVVLDIGTGAGQVPIKLAQRNASLIIHGSDLSGATLHRAAVDATSSGVALRILLDRCDATDMPYDAGLFDLVLCNGVLHQVSNPLALLREMDRVAKPSGAVFLRDYVRPGRLSYSWRMRRYGRAYSGRLLELFESSLRASYTVSEVKELLKESGVEGLQVVRFSAIHLGIQRCAHR